MAAARLGAWLAEDVPYGDLTTELLGIVEIRGRITFATRDEMVLSGIEAAAGLLERVGAHPRAVPRSGASLAAGEAFLMAEGTAGALHRAWKVTQTLVEYASGIATRARRLVDAAGPEIVVACTARTCPGSRRSASTR